MRDCILVDGPLSKGYGRVKVGGVWVLAHRAAWESQHGPLAEGLVLHHHCGNADCINVTHLEAMTQSEHMQVHRKLWAERPCKRCGGPRDRIESDGTRVVRRCDRCRKDDQKKADKKRRT